MTRAIVDEGASKSSRHRIWAFACTMVMIIVAFQSLNARASPPDTGLGEYNHALAIHGGTATASGFTSPYFPANTIDGNAVTFWQASDRLGWLTVSFSPRAFINEVHVHFLGVVYPGLSLYYDTNGNGLFETTEKVWSTTTNLRLDLIVATATTQASGMKVTIDVKVGSKVPKIAEFEAYLRYDSDGDGLTNADEAAVTYYQDMRAAGMPHEIPNAGQDTVLFYNMGTTSADGKMKDLSHLGSLTAVTTSCYLI